MVSMPPATNWESHEFSQGSKRIPGSEHSAITIDYADGCQVRITRPFRPHSALGSGSHSPPPSPSSGQPPTLWPGPGPGPGPAPGPAHNAQAGEGYSRRRARPVSMPAQPHAHMYNDGAHMRHPGNRSWPEAGFGHRGDRHHPHGHRDAHTPRPERFTATPRAPNDSDVERQQGRQRRNSSNQDTRHRPQPRPQPEDPVSQTPSSVSRLSSSSYSQSGRTTPRPRPRGNDGSSSGGHSRYTASPRPGVDPRQRNPRTHRDESRRRASSDDTRRYSIEAVVGRHGRGTPVHNEKIRLELRELRPDGKRGESWRCNYLRHEEDSDDRGDEVNHRRRRRSEDIIRAVRRFLPFTCWLFGNSKDGEDNYEDEERPRSRLRNPRSRRH
ncbi:hypothetical protein GGR51DRAFT_199877 [Nemania sp. FL0031]|nr:hypothetical protein GGR51DRAFT_199877 [Nemania sp. FL0031]